MPDSANYPQAFIDAVAGVLKNEGGYVCNPSDPGGETNHGISKHAYPNLDIKNLTEDDARAIYFRDYWQKFHLSDLPDSIAIKVFNIGVDTYLPPAIICLQRALRACGAPALSETGVIDAETKTTVAGLLARHFGFATAGAGEFALMAALRSELAAHYRLIAQHQKRTQVFINGWLNRAYA